MPSRRSMPSLRGGLVAALLGASSFGAAALGFGPSRLATTLGGPLDFSVVVLLDANEALPRECIVADVMVGEIRLPPAQVLAIVQAGGTARQQTVRVQTNVGIAEPVVTVEVTLGCEARVSRRFVHLIDPPPIGTPVLPTATMPGGALRGAAPAASGAPRRPARRAPAVTPAQPKPPGAAMPAGSEAPGRREATAMAPSKPPARWSLPSPVVRWLDALPFATARAAEPAAEWRLAQAAEPAAPPVVAGAVAAAASGSTEQARIADLEAGIAELRGDTRDTQREMAILQTRLRDAERERWANPIVYASTAFALIACLIAVRASRQAASGRRAPAGEGGERPEGDIASLPPVRRIVDAPSAVLRTTDQVPVPDRRSVDRSLPLEARLAAAATAAMPSSISATASPAAAARPVPVPPTPTTRPESRASAAVSGEAPATTRPAAFDALARSTTVSGTSAIGGLEVTTMLAPVRAAREAANTGALDSGWQPMQASAVEELVDLMQQVEFFTVLGQDMPAIDLLESHVKGGGPASPLPFFDLLALHAERGDEAAYERVRGLWRGRFGDDAPPWESREAALEGAGGLTAEPQVLARLQALWPTPLQALGALESLLFREDRARVLPRRAYHDLHFLYGLARDLADHVETDSGAVDLFLPIETEASTPFTVLEATTPFRGPPPERGEPPADPGSPSTLDVDLSAWPDDVALAAEGGDDEFAIVRMPGRRGAA